MGRVPKANEGNVKTGSVSQLKGQEGGGEAKAVGTPHRATARTKHASRGTDGPEDGDFIL